MPQIRVCRFEELKKGRGNKVTVEGEDLVLFVTGEEVAAALNFCPHQRFAKLHDGSYENSIVTCPMHGWSFDVRTGRSVNAGGRLTLYPAEVKEGVVFVTIP